MTGKVRSKASALRQAKQALLAAQAALERLEKDWPASAADRLPALREALEHSRGGADQLAGLLTAAQAEIGQAAPAGLAGAKSVTDAGLVLIIDDDPDGSFMLEQALAKGGYRTDTAYDGLSGLARAKQPDVALVLLDVMLPGLDGFEVCHRLRKDPATANLPIIMISAKGRDEDRATGLRMGANEYMAKPLRLAEVLEKVGAVLDPSDQEDHD